jgi:tetratricopeptide (TPR) repeat protein
MRTTSSARPSAARRSDVAHLQERLASRLLLVFLVPCFIIVLLGVFAYRLSARVGEVEVLERVSYVDRVFRDTHNVPWALAEYSMLAAKFPDNARIYVRLGALYHEDDQDDRAVEFLQRAIALKADEWEAYSTLAYVELSRRNDRSAIDAGETAIRHNDADAQAFNNLAWIYATTRNEQIRDLAKAETYAKKAVTFTRCRQKDYLDTLAEVYRRSGRVEQSADVASTSGLCARPAFASTTTGGR